MSPIRSPSPFETSADPGDVLLSESISLEGSATESVPGPSVRSKLPRGEIILLKTEDLCPTEPNGKAASRVLADLLKRLADVGVKAVVGGVRALVDTSLPVEDDSSSANPEEAGIGTFSIVLCTKKAIFDEALAGLDSLSTSIYIKAFIDPGAAEPSVDDVMLRVEKAGLLSWEGCNGEQGDCGGDMREAVHDYANTGASGFVLINVSNDLGGEGQGFLQMQELDENDHNGDIDVCYSGTGF